MSEYIPEEEICERNELCWEMYETVWDEVVQPSVQGEVEEHFWECVKEGKPFSWYGNSTAC